MKTTAQITAYLRNAGGDIAEARRIAMREHHTSDQTLTAKFAELERIAKGETK